MEPHSLTGAYSDSGSQVLWEDGERVFRRGWRLGDNGERRPVLIVVPAGDHPSRSSFDRLTHEFELRDELDGAWAVRPLDLVRDAGRTMLVLEEADGEPLDRLLGVPMEAGRFLCLAPPIAAALGKLHQRGLVHKDIKPANVLVDEEAGEVRLTGFGIASRLVRERQSPHPPDYRRHARLHGARADRTDEPVNRLPQRSLCTWCHLLPNAYRCFAVYRRGSDGVGALPYRAPAGTARRARPRLAVGRLRYCDEAARQGSRRSLPDRRRRRAGPAILSGRMGNQGSYRRLPAGPTRHARSTVDSRETLRAAT